MRLTYLLLVTALVYQACAVDAAHSLLLNRQTDEVSTLDGVHPECTASCQAFFDNFDRCGAGEVVGNTLDAATAQCMCTSEGFSVMEACITCMVSHAAAEDAEAMQLQLEATSTAYATGCSEAGVPVSSDGASDGADSDTADDADADADPADAAEGATAGTPNTAAAGSSTSQTKGAAATGTPSGSAESNSTVSDDAAAEDSAASRPGMLAVAMLAALAGGAALF